MQATWGISDFDSNVIFQLVLSMGMDRFLQGEERTLQRATLACTAIIQEMRRTPIGQPILESLARFAAQIT